MSRSAHGHEKEAITLTVEELAERIWDEGYMSIAELQSDLRELWDEAHDEGYAEAVARVKDAAKKLTQ